MNINDINAEMLIGRRIVVYHPHRRIFGWIIYTPEFDASYLKDKVCIMWDGNFGPLDYDLQFILNSNISISHIAID